MDIEELIKLYESAEKEIIAQIEATDFLKRIDKEKTLKQIQNILISLYKPSSEFIISGSKKEYQSGIQEVQEALNKLDLKGSFNLVDPKAAEFILGSLDDIQAGALADAKQVLSNSYTNIQNSLNLVSKQVKSDLASDIAKQALNKIGSSQILGKARTRISKELASLLTEKGITGFTYNTEKGQTRNLSLKAYVDGLTRSTLINSRASAVTSRALESGHDLLKIDTHGNPSPMCAKWQGKIVSISGKTLGYPTLSEALFNGDYKRGGILHRYCRHSLTIYIETDIKFNP